MEPHISFAGESDEAVAHFTQVDHTFRFKAITGFDPKRSAVSADVDHREQGADEGLVSRGVGGRQAA